MLGEIFALGAAVSNGIEEVLTRQVMREGESVSYTAAWHLVVAALFLPLFVLEFTLPAEPGAWVLVLLSGIAWGSALYLMFKAYKTLEVSVKVPIWKSRMLFAFVFAVLILGEGASMAKIAGTLLVFAGIVLVTYEPKLGFANLKGEAVLLVLLAAALSGLALVIDRMGLAFFPPGMFGFMSMLTTLVLLLPFALGKRREFSMLFTRAPLLTLGATLSGALAYYLILLALKATEASIAIPLIELGTLVAVGGGIVFLDERKDIAKKLVAALLAVAGAILVGL
jgi:drug/metabolite transporter (DMT)-like permease